MNIALLGYGKMGRQIAKLLIPRGHTIALIVDEANAHELTVENLKERRVDVAIEFTSPQAAYGNIIKCLDAGVAVVCGTTGWYESYDDVVLHCTKLKGAFCFSPNYSVTVNILMMLNAALAEMMEPLPAYDMTIEEVHHVHKKDAPSGTAVALAQGIIDRIERKKKWVGHTSTEPDELEVLSVRRSNVPGNHCVTYESDDDMIQLYHTMKNRRSLAEGVIKAVEFIYRKTGVFSMKDVLGFEVGINKIK